MTCLLRCPGFPARYFKFVDELSMKAKCGVAIFLTSVSFISFRDSSTTIITGSEVFEFVMKLGCRMMKLLFV